MRMRMHTLRLRLAFYSSSGSYTVTKFEIWNFVATIVFCYINLVVLYAMAATSYQNQQLRTPNNSAP
jgi:hypothetical protein